MARQLWKYGGIIPVLPGQDLYLLGREHDGSWSWFGGHTEPEDRSIYETAAREAYEESMGLLGSIEELKGRAISSTRIDSTFFLPVSLEEAQFIPVAFNRVHGYFSHCLLGCPQGYLEKTEVKWFSWIEMISFGSGVDPKDIEVVSRYRVL